MAQEPEICAWGRWRRGRATTALKTKKPWTLQNGNRDDDAVLALKKPVAGSDRQALRRRGLWPRACGPSSTYHLRADTFLIVYPFNALVLKFCGLTTTIPLHRRRDVVFFFNYAQLSAITSPDRLLQHHGITVWCLTVRCLQHSVQLLPHDGKYMMCAADLERRAPRQRTPRVRSDRVISVSDHVWVSMEIDRIDRWRFGSVVALSDDSLVRGTRGLMPLPDGDYVAVQRIPSSDLAMFANRAVDGMLPSPGDLWNIRDETFPVT